MSLDKDLRTACKKKRDPLNGVKEIPLKRIPEVNGQDINEGKNQQIYYKEIMTGDIGSGELQASFDSKEDKVPVECKRNKSCSVGRIPLMINYISFGTGRGIP